MAARDLGVFGMRLELREEPVEYRFTSNRCCAVVVVLVVDIVGGAVLERAARMWSQQLEHVHRPLLARRLIRFDADVLILANGTLPRSKPTVARLQTLLRFN